MNRMINKKLLKKFIVLLNTVVFSSLYFMFFMFLYNMYETHHLSELATFLSIMSPVFIVSGFAYFKED